MRSACTSEIVTARNRHFVASQCPRLNPVPTLVTGVSLSESTLGTSAHRVEWGGSCPGEDPTSASVIERRAAGQVEARIGLRRGVRSEPTSSRWGLDLLPSSQTPRQVRRLERAFPPRFENRNLSRASRALASVALVLRHFHGCLRSRSRSLPRPCPARPPLLRVSRVAGGR